MALAILLLVAQAADDNWPSFRGRQASGVAEGAPSPERWDAPKWKTPIPGLAHSSPVIWGDRLFAITAVREGDAELKVGLYGDIKPVDEPMSHKWVLLALDKSTGQVLWEKTAHEGVPRIRRHPKSTHANSTPATDGKHVVCLFGSEGMFCFDVEGALLWKKDLGALDSGYFQVPSAQWGFASSPVIHEGRVIVQADVQKGSFLAAYDLEDGREVWRASRDEVPTWGTPTVEAGQVIVNGWKHIGGYDLETGKEVWRLRGGGDIPVPTPVVAHGLAFLTNAHGGKAPIYAVRLGAKGDVSLKDKESSNDGVAWSRAAGGNYMQTPLVYGDRLYGCSDSGVVSCYDARTGESLYRERLAAGGAGFTASPVASDGKLYFTSEPGMVFVVKAGPKFEVLARNDLGETCLSTPALSTGVLYFRTRRHLVAVAR